MSVGFIKNAVWTTPKGSEPYEPKPYHMVHIIWSISYGLYHMVHMANIICPIWSNMASDQTEFLRLHMDIYKFLYFRHCIWLQLSIQLFLDLCSVMFKSSWESFLAVSSLPNQKNVQITRRQCKRDWHMHRGRLHPWERQNYRKLQYLASGRYKILCIFCHFSIRNGSQRLW